MPTPTFADFLANWPIFRDAVLTGAFAGALLGFLGVQVVLRRMVFASSAISQAAALGVALSFWIPSVLDPIGHAAAHSGNPGVHSSIPLVFDPVVWALGTSLLATLLFTANPTRWRITGEGLLGIVFLASAAFAVIIGDRLTQETHDLAAILFGSAVVVRQSDLALVTAAMFSVIGLHVLFWRPLIFVAFDPVGARVQGLPARKLNTFVFLAVGVAVAFSTRALGALPVFAFSVLPALAALMLSTRLSVVFGIAALLGAGAGAGGYLVSFRAETPVGATQSALAVVVLLLALAWRGVARALARPRSVGASPAAASPTSPVHPSP
jgi:zinc transport system permease protein